MHFSFFSHFFAIFLVFPFFCCKFAARIYIYIKIVIEYQQQMKNFRFWLLCVLSWMSLEGFAQWTEEMYNQYTYSNYTNFAPFSQSKVSTGYDADLLEAAVFYETNRQRALHGLTVLKYDHNLMVSAHNHSVDMVNENFFSHTSPVPGYTTMSDRLEKVGIQYREAAENIALSSAGTTYVETARALVNQWMNSQGHRENRFMGQNAGYNMLSA